MFDAALHSPAMFDDSVAKCLFVLYQLIQLLNHLHGLGVTLGEISLQTIVVDTRLWVQVRPNLQSMLGAPPCDKGSKNNDVQTPSPISQPSKEKSFL